MPEVSPHIPEAFQALVAMEQTKEGTHHISSTGNEWYAFDTGNGVSTDGVNTCVALVEPRFLAHISPLRSEDDLTQLTAQMRAKGISSVEVYGGATDPRFKDSRVRNRVLAALDQAGISYHEHPAPDSDSSQIIVVKTGQKSVFQLDGDVIQKVE